MQSPLTVICLILLMASASLLSQINCQVVDGEGSPVPYVNIYLPEANRGVLSDEAGNFTLNLTDVPDSTKVTFSCLNYAPLTLTAADLKQRPTPNCTVQLSESAYTTQTVEVRASSVKYKYLKLGVPRPTIFSRMGYNAAGRGTERGLVIDNRRRCRLDQVSVYVNTVRLDSFDIELNVYAYHGGKVGHKIQKEGIFATISAEDSNSSFAIPLRELGLFVEGPFVVSTTMLNDSQDGVTMLEATPKAKYKGLQHRLDGSWVKVGSAPSVAVELACPK